MNFNYKDKVFQQHHGISLPSDNTSNKINKIDNAMGDIPTKCN